MRSPIEIEFWQYENKIKSKHNGSYDESMMLVSMYERYS